MSRAEIDAEGGQPRPFFLDSKVNVPCKASVRLMKATSESNASIIEDIRDSVRNQVAVIKRNSMTEPMTPQQADVLLKLTKVFQIMDVATDKEHSKYNFSGLSEDELARLAEGKKL